MTNDRRPARGRRNHLDTRDTAIIWLYIIILILTVMLAVSLYQNEKILDGWRQAQDYWQSLPLEYPEVGE